MKILISHIDKKFHSDCPLSIPDDILNEEQAQINHGQSLKRLNERGGLAPCEVIAIIEKRYWHRMPINESINKLKELINQ